MTQVEIIKGVSLSSLAESAPTKMSNFWQSGHQRTQILILIQRRHRQRFEGHSATVGLKHPCWAIFYRPRVEADEIEEYGLDPKNASFMFLDVALEDLGRWVGPLVKDEWPKEEVIITPSEDAEEYTPTKWTTFRDPWLDSLEVLPLAFAPHDIEGKAWLTNPSPGGTIPVAQAATDTFSNQVDSDFAGKLADLTHSFGTTDITPSEATPPPVTVTAPAAPTFVMPSGPISIPNLGSTPVAEEEPPAPQPEITLEPAPTEPAAATYLSPQPVDVPEITKNVVQAEAPSEPDATNVEMNVPEESEQDEGLEIREELVDIIQLLIAGGLEPEQVMESPAFQEVSERATAAGLDVWSIFIENAN